MCKINNIKGAIFDLDGTTLDSMWVWHDVDRRFLGKRGFEVPTDYMHSVKHLSAAEIADYTIARFSLADTPAGLMEEWSELAYEAYKHEVKLKPFVREYIEKLYRSGVKLAIATALDRELALATLKSNHILGYLDNVTCLDEVSRGKGFPDVYLKASEKLGLAPNECVVFEDILLGVKAAKQGGFVTIGVYDRDSEYDKEEIQSVAHKYIHSFEELL